MLLSNNRNIEIKDSFKYSTEIITDKAVKILKNELNRVNKHYYSCDNYIKNYLYIDKYANSKSNNIINSKKLNTKNKLFIDKNTINKTYESNKIFLYPLSDNNNVNLLSKNDLNISKVNNEYLTENKNIKNNYNSKNKLFDCNLDKNIDNTIIKQHNKEEKNLLFNNKNIIKHINNNKKTSCLFKEDSNFYCNRNLNYYNKINLNPVIYRRSISIQNRNYVNNNINKNWKTYKIIQQLKKVD